MYNFVKTVLGLNKDKRAVTALEYALVAATICAVAATGYTSLGNKLTTELTNITSKI